MFGVKIGPLQAGNWTTSNVGVLCFDLNGVNCNYIISSKTIFCLSILGIQMLKKHLY